PVPEKFKEADDQVVEVINAKLSHLARNGIIPDNSWNIKIPLRSREKGGVRSGCFISFLKELNVPIERIAMTRVLLSDTEWPRVDDEKYRIRCAWGRDRKFKPKEPKSIFKPIKSIEKSIEKPVEKVVENPVEKVVKKTVERRAPQNASKVSPKSEPKSGNRSTKFEKKIVKVDTPDLPEMPELPEINFLEQPMFA
ncbi:MAG: hypothetical protein MUO21_00945, partial [Nitrososphaeraceae archaeon]|nr:hypothetical protein [Nitrososphaeraceae archaeon]